MDFVPVDGARFIRMCALKGKVCSEGFFETTKGRNYVLDKEQKKISICLYETRETKEEGIICDAGFFFLLFFSGW